MDLLPSMFDPANPNKSHSYISLCEVEPGIIWAGGYSRASTR